jgi:hypothetical protein
VSDLPPEIPNVTIRERERERERERRIEARRAPHLHGAAQALRLVAVEERRLRAIRLVEEAVHSSEHHRHREFVRIDEVQRLGHGHEQLVADAFGHAILLHPLAHGILVLRVRIPVVTPGHYRYAHVDESTPTAPHLSDTNS